MRESLPELIVNDQLLVRAGIGWQDGIVGKATVDTGLSSQAGYTLLHHRPVVVHDIRREKRFDVDKRLYDHGIRSTLTVNVPGTGDAPLGTLGAYTTSQRGFSDADTKFLARIAKILGGAMQQAAAEEQARHTEQQLNALRQASYMLCASQDYDAALASAAKIALDNLADWCFVDVAFNNHNGSSNDIHRLARAKETLHGQDDEHPPYQESYDYPTDTTLRHGTASILRTGQPEMISPVDGALLQNIAHDEHLELLYHLRPDAYMCVPMHARQRLIGSMGFVCTNSEGYGQQDLDLAGILARYTALTLTNSLQFPTGNRSGKVAPKQLVRHSKHHNLVVPETVSHEVPYIRGREMEVLQMLGMGFTPKQIALKLNIAVNTVNNHTKSIRAAFGVDKTQKAIDKARSLGILLDPSANS